MVKYSTEHLPNFQDLYSWEDISFTRDSVSAFCGYFPIALCAQCDIEILGNNRIRGKYELGKTSQATYTLRYYYALQVLYTAIGVVCNSTYRSFYRFYPPHWIKRNESFMMLEESEYTHPEFRKYVWSLLEEIENSGEIKVSEGRFLCNNTTGYYGNQIISHCDTDIWLQMVVIIDKDSHELTPHNKELRTYKWDDIKHFYVELSLPQIELLNHKWMHRFSPIDLELFRACNDLNLEHVKHAVSVGANVNALCPDGNSAIQYAIKFFYEYGLDYNIKYTAEEKERIVKENYKKCKSIVDYLLDEGADINLFGYSGILPIVEAYYCNSYDMIKYLLERGANPNLNCYLTDDSNPDIVSTLLELLAEYNDDNVEEELKMKQLLLAYGAIRRRS